MSFTWPLIALLIGFGLLQAALGYGIAVWLARRRNRAAPDGPRKRNLVRWLTQITGIISDDVDRHQSRIEEISRRLGEIGHDQQAPLAELVIELVNQIVESNQRLKDELAVAELQLQRQELQLQSHLEDALTDKLTRLPNRRAFDTDLGRRFAAWRRHHSPLSLALLDIDHFKQLNDTYGHLCGDRVLQQMAVILSESLREMDLVARYGGEEFAVILPETSGGDACVAIEKVIRTVEGTKFQFEGRELTVTISGGVASAAEVDASPGEFVRRADQALYASKNAGRNCGHFHDGAKPIPFTPREDAGESNPGASSTESAAGDLQSACEELRRRIEEMSDSQE